MKKFLAALFLIFIFISPVFAKKQVSSEPDTILYMNLEFWESFNDDILNNHLKTLYESNYDLKNAQLKMQEANELVRMQFANELPEISFDGNIYRDFRSSMQKFGSMAIPSFAQNNFVLPLTMGYEIDIWGKNRLKTKSEKESQNMIREKQRALYIALTSDFCADYFNLIKADKLLAIQDDMIKIQKEILSKVKEKKNLGLASDFEVLEEEKILTRLNEEKNNLEEKQDVLINSIKAYLAVCDDVERVNYDKIKLLDNVSLEFDSNIISNRPDYQISEAYIKKIGYDVKIAKKEFLPDFVIFGQIGLNAYSLSSLFNKSSQLVNAGVAPNLDLFSGGRKLAFLRYNKIKYEQAINDYQQTILNALKEVDTAISEYKITNQNYLNAKERLFAQDKLYNLVLDKNKIGSTSNLDLLYSKEADLSVQKEEVTNKINCLISVISLYKALGGINFLKANV